MASHLAGGWVPPEASCAPQDLHLLGRGHVGLPGRAVQGGAQERSTLARSEPWPGQSGSLGQGGSGRESSRQFEAEMELTCGIRSLPEKPLIPVPSKITLLLVRQTQGWSPGLGQGSPREGAICHHLHLRPEGRLRGISQPFSNRTAFI